MSRESTPFLDACRGLSTDFTPVWLYRQAGRYMPEYRALKGNHRSLDFFTNPDLAAQATLDAQRILGVDAAIVFADLLPLLRPMGLNLDYYPNIGPVINNPIRAPKDVVELRNISAVDDCAYIAQTVRNIRSDLPNGIGLIGFAGAPFTLAAYAIEGQGSKHFNLIRKFMYSYPESWDLLMQKITTAVADYVNLQIHAGVDVVQFFDSWVGCVSQSEYQLRIAPWIVRLFDRLPKGVPLIYFGTGNAHLLRNMANTRPAVLAADWRVDLAEVWDELGCSAMQGNLDPALLCAPESVMIAHTKALLESIKGRAGYIFNLGHGIAPEASVDNVKRLVDFVHDFQLPD